MPGAQLVLQIFGQPGLFGPKLVQQCRHHNVPKPVLSVGEQSVHHETNLALQSMGVIDLGAFTLKQ